MFRFTQHDIAGGITLELGTSLEFGHWDLEPSALWQTPFVRVDKLE
jgi:hypothetical protein